MKSISGRHLISPISPSLEEPNARRDSPKEPAGPKRKSGQANPQGEAAAPSKRLRSSRHGMGANSASLLQRQLVNEYNAKPGAPAASAGSERKGPQTRSQALSPRKAAAPIAFPDLAKPATSHTPFEAQLDNDADFDWLPPIVELDIDQDEQALLAKMADEPVNEVAGVDAARPWPQLESLDRGVDDLDESDPFLGFLDDGISPVEERALLAMMAVDVSFADAASPLDQQMLMDLDLDAEYEADDVLYRLERPFTDEQEQALQTKMDEDLLNEADEVDVRTPGPQRVPTAVHAKPPAEAPTPAKNTVSQLQQLGYSKIQAFAIKPESRSEVVKHHQALSNLGFDLEDITTISEHAPSLQVLARNYLKLRKSLPNLSRSEIVAIAKEPAGHLTLKALLYVAKDLKSKPPYLDDQQLAAIAKTGKRPSLKALHSLGQDLSGHPYNLKSEELVSVASNRGGGPALGAIKLHLSELVKAGLSRQEVVAIASSNNGHLELDAIRIQLPKLVKAPYSMTPKEVGVLVSTSGGKLALDAVIACLPRLVGAPYQLSREQVLAIASKLGGGRTLEAIVAYLPKLLSPTHKLSRDQVVEFADHHYGYRNLEKIIRHEMIKPHRSERDLPLNFEGTSTNPSSAFPPQALPRQYPPLPYGPGPFGPPHHFPPNRVAPFPHHPYGHRNLERIVRPEMVGPYWAQRDPRFNLQKLTTHSTSAVFHQALPRKYQQLGAILPNLSSRKIMDIAKEPSGEWTLKVLFQVAKDLKEKPPHLNDQQLADIAKTGKGQALLAVHSLVQELSAHPSYLRSEQLVSIACKRGFKLALKLIQSYLPVLVEAPYGLAHDKVVAIATSSDGAQVLESISKHLPKLVKAPYDLAVEQVVAMASYGAGRRTLQAINDYLPELVNTSGGLNCKQVVAIATSTGGAQLLEATKHQLAKLLKPPYGLISHQVVTIATKGGGKPGLEAVIEHLPKLLGAPFDMTRQQVVGLASRPYGKWLLEEIIRTKKVV